MTPETIQWRDVPVGAYVRASGVVWRVDDIQHTGVFTLYNPTSGQREGAPPLSAEVEVVRMPPADLPAERDALLTLRVMMGAVVTACAWCGGADDGACECDVHCGADRCINFVRTLEIQDS